MSNCCTNTLNKLWAISYAVALANVIRMLNWLFSVSGLDIMLKCEEKKTSEMKVQCLIYIEARVTIFLSLIWRKMLGEKKAWSKIWSLFGNTCLDMWRRKKDAGGGMGEHVQENGIIYGQGIVSVLGVFWFFWLCGSTPHDWKNHSWGREKSIQVDPECTVTNSLSYALDL